MVESTHGAIAGQASHTPGVNFRIARQEPPGPIACCPLQKHPRQIISDPVPTCDCEPHLASVVGINRPLNPHVRARPEHRNIETPSVIPLLPDVEALSVDIRIGAAKRTRAVEMPRRVVAERTAMWAISEITWHTSSPSPPKFQIILAHRLRQPSMAGRLLEEERGNQGLQHVFKENGKITLLLNELARRSERLEHSILGLC